MMNPFQRAIKKYAHELIPGAYTESIDEMLDRVGTITVNQRDTEKFIKFMLEIYSAGYTKAMNDTKDRLAQEGIKLKIKSPS